MPTQKQLMRFALLAAAGVGRHYVRRRRRMDFRGKTVVITGGSRGLGLELGRLWSAEGARVAICSRTKDDVEAAVSELRQVTGEVHGETCDITQPPEVESFRYYGANWTRFCG
jgi:NADP-dependent 3-hydroxy acid dehydrogenase YdfG